jgi:hypothetical protein
MSKDNPILDLRDKPYKNQVEALLLEYRKANNTWKPYDIDPRLKEKFKVMEEILENHLRFINDEV